MMELMRGERLDRRGGEDKECQTERRFFAVKMRKARKWVVLRIHVTDRIRGR